MEVILRLIGTKQFAKKKKPFTKIYKIMAGYFLDPNACLILSLQLFFIGVAGLISSQNNIIFVMISLEMMLFAASLGFVFFSAFSLYTNGGCRWGSHRFSSVNRLL